MVEAGKNNFYLVLYKDAAQGSYLDLGELSSKFGLRFVVLLLSNEFLYIMNIFHFFKVCLFIY